MGAEFPLMFPDRDDVIMPQWAIKVSMQNFLMWNLPECGVLALALLGAVCTC